MKITLTLALLVATVAIHAQQLVPILDPLIPVTPTNTNGSTRPRITLVNDTIPLVTWTKTGSGNGIIYSSRWNGTAFDPAVQVTPSGLNVYCSGDEGGDVAARGDTAFIVFFTTDSRTFSVRSVDGGMTWQDTVRIDHQAPGDMSYTPDVQILRGGNPVIVFEQSDMTMTLTRMKVCRSSDGGQTYSMETDAHLGVTGIPCECCPPALLVNDSMVYVFYRNNDNNLRNIVMTVSSDSGNTFPVISEFDQSNWTISACPTAGAEAMFYQDSILATWKSANKIYYGCGHAVNGGESPHALLEPSLASTVVQKQPSVCGSGDTVVYTWSDRRTANYDVYVAISGSGPMQIATPSLFNDTTGTSENGTQQNPHAVYANGKVHLVYQDLVTGIVIYRVATVGGGVSVPELEPAEVVNIYPVPATETFSYSSASTETATVQVFSVTGALVASYTNVRSGQVLNCSALLPGTYTVLVTDAQGNESSSKLIKH